MQRCPELIVMLTHHDMTLQDAFHVFEEGKDAPVSFWGLKEKPLSRKELIRLFDRMKECGKKTGLEVVEYTQEESLRGAKLAFECGCDYLLGTSFFDSVNSFCLEKKIRYLPFVGQVHSRPSVLEGKIQEMIDDAHSYLEKGVFGLDLLGYRYTGNAEKLIEEFVRQVNAPVCVAGSVNSLERLKFLKKVRPEFFTIGGAFFEHRFGTSLTEQIEKVVGYLNEP